MNSLVCLYCGGDPFEPDHEQRCDGRQGGREDPPPFNPREAFIAAEAGIATARIKLERPDGPAWLDAAVDAIRAVASRQPVLTSDDVWRHMGEAGDVYQSQIGIAIRKAKQLQIIRFTGMSRESHRPSRHRSFVRVWESLIFCGVVTR